MTENVNIYKTEEYTAVIVTDERGAVIDLEIHFKPASEYARRTAQRRRPYSQKKGLPEMEDETQRLYSL